MPFSAGTRLGHYEIVAPLGAGGMGEVYRARDSQLERDVAIKVLPRALASDPERLARFDREAKILAALNHPNIAVIHGLVEHDGQRALVMELVPGDTLAATIKRGPMPVQEACKVARQIAEALEAAHDKGIVHRDLKPGNVMITPTGLVKVLDFGLAAIAQPAAASDPNNSPTLTMGMTQAGAIMGTASYMSPEQAEGLQVDKRSDIWSYGVVLWEMLTGKRLFEGQTVSRTLADVLRAPVEFDRITAPAPIQSILRRCLDRDVRNRLRDIGEARVAIDSVGSGAESPGPGGTPAVSLPHKTRWAGWAVAGALAMALGGVSTLHFRETLPQQQSVQFQIGAPDDAQFRDLSLSADGRFLAFTTFRQGGFGSLWLRSLDSLESREVPETRSARLPFWSPDGEFVAFFHGTKLKKMARSGGPPVELCDVGTLPNLTGGTWRRDGVIVFSSNGLLSRVSANGGVPEKLPLPEGGSPRFLPDGNILFNGPMGLSVRSLDDSSPIQVLQGRTTAQYVPPAGPGANGHLLFPRGDALMAQPVDAGSFALRGDVFPVADRDGGGGAFAASDNGILVYGQGNRPNRQLVWVDRTGRRLSAATKPFASPNNPAIALAPDDSRAAIPIAGPNRVDFWIQDFTRGTLSRFTFEGSSSAVWSPDGKRLLVEAPAGARNLKNADGSGTAETLFKMPADCTTCYLYDWSLDGKWIAFTNRGEKTQLDVWMVPTEGDHKMVPLVQGPFNETWGRFSPDGKWIAYDSDESGQSQVWVQSVPAGGGRWQISTDGGSWAKWRRDGKELFYREGNKMMAVPMSLTPTAVLPGKTVMLFEAADETRFQVSRDGQRFLLSFPAEGESAAQPLTVVTNWRK